MRRLGAIVTVSTLVVLLGGCSSSETTEPTGVTQPSADTSTEPAGAEAGTLTIVDFGFEPADVTPGPDGELAITNEGATTHTFTMDDDSVSEEIAPGDSVTVTVGQEGGFHCEIHPTMTGTVLAT